MLRLIRGTSGVVGRFYQVEQNDKDVEKRDQDARPAFMPAAYGRLLRPVSAVVPARNPVVAITPIALPTQP